MIRTSNGLTVTRTFMIVALAFIVGISSVYALVPTFVAAAVVLLWGLWSFAKNNHLSCLASEYGEGLEQAKLRPRNTLTGRLVSGYLLVWWLAVVLVLGRVYTSASFQNEEIAQSARQATAEGLLLNQSLVISYGAVGGLFLLAAIKRSNIALRWILALLLIYLCWGFISLFWSVDPSLTARRLVAFILMSLGSIGFGAGFYGRQPNGISLFLRHVILAGTFAALALLIPLAFRLNVVSLLDPAYVLRLATNTYSYVAFPAVVALSTLLITPMLKLRDWRRSDWLLVLILALAVFVLKTRGPVLFAILALSIIYVFYKARVAERALQIGVLLIVLLGTYILYSEELLTWLTPYLTRTEDQQLTYSLTGRVPLWDILQFDIEQHPLVGVGFGAYWNLENMARVQEAVGFPAVVAHNGFIEELLATGAVGLTLLLTFLGYVSYIAVKRIRQGDPFGWITLLFVLLYLLLNVTQSLMQAYLEVPFIVLLVAIGLMESRRSVKARNKCALGASY